MKKIFYILSLLLFFSSCKETKNDEVTTQQSDTITVTNDQFKTMNMKIGVLEEQNFDILFPKHFDFQWLQFLKLPLVCGSCGRHRF